jgi:hypothetical protein
MLEADCTRCKETFVPLGDDPDDLIHGERLDGKACGGIGIIQGEWVPPGKPPRILRWGMILTQQEEHGLQEPDCTEPDCPHHFPRQPDPRHELYIF